jgi:hypothetical protein
MPKVAYKEIRFKRETASMIIFCNQIIEHYAAQGYDITLRQLYYQLVAKGVIENELKSYKRLVDLITNARYAGEIDWEHVVDRTRFVRQAENWPDAHTALADRVEEFMIDKWSVERGQKFRPLVMVEKDALVAVFTRMCRDLDVPVLSCRGYTSASAMWRLAMRLSNTVRAGQVPVLLHFGDHDPSGMDMSRDIVDRLTEFVYAEVEESFDFERLALNRDQIDKFKPPPSYAKVTDSRWKGYILEHGEHAWELDALEPALLAGLVKEEVLKLRNDRAWARACEEEESYRAPLRAAAENWSRMQTVLGKTPKGKGYELKWVKPKKRKKPAAKRASKKSKSRKAASKRGTR